MSQKGKNLQSRMTPEVSLIASKSETKNIGNKVPVKAHTDIACQGTKSGNSKYTEEISDIVDENSTTLSLPPVSVSCTQKDILENPSAERVESVVQGGSVSVQDLNTLLNSKDTRVMFISPDGTLVFDHPDFSSHPAENMPIILDSDASISASDTSLNSNYLIVVENVDGSQMLSTTVHRNLVLTSASDIPVSSITPETHISFSTVGNDEGSKIRDVTDYTQSTITMVLDNASSNMHSKELLVEPSSFITYSDQTSVATDQFTFHTVHPVSDKTELSNSHLYESSEGSFIDMSSLNVLASETSSNTAGQHASTTKTVLFNAQTTQSVVIQKDPATVKSHIQKCLLQPATETSVSSVSTADSLTALKDSCSKQREEVEEEQIKKEKMKQELRFLEQCHLEHHLKQVQKKKFEKETSENDAEENEDDTMLDHNDHFLAESETEQLEKLSVDDETPIFSMVTATLNSTILANITGCQQFLLDKAKENSCGFDIEFTSDTDCTFSGTLKSLIILHNILKNLIQLKSKTLLEFRTDQSKHSSLDKAVMCDLLKPYVSLRGRQPKCSFKAAEMGFVNDIDLYLQTDVTDDIADREYEKIGAEDFKQKYKRTRKRGRPSKGFKSKVQKIKVKYAAQMDTNANETNREASCKGQEVSEVNELEENDVVDESLAEHKSKHDVMNSDKAVLTDPLQQRLLEEQLKCKKIVNQKQRQLNCILDVDGSDVPDLVNLSNIIDRDESENNNDSTTATFEDSQENSSASVTPAVGRPRRGRPRKAYNHLCMREKVHARNPLTESAATKQQRNYEEQVSFKFFCPQCSFKTKRQSHFASHMRCHKDGTEKKYTCKQCDFVTISIPMLKRHELKHSKSLFKCGICTAYTTDRQELLRRHFRMKHCVEQRELMKGKLVCDRCRFSCLTSEELDKHKSVHDRLNQVPDGDILNCPDCNKPFRSRMHLQRHIRDVHGPEVRPHLCDKCGKAFKRTDALQQHKLVHVSRTARSFPFKCTSCEKGFRSPAHLKEHMSMHSSERPFLCQYCGAAFKTQPVQKKHILTLHIKPRAHVCSVCSRQFNTKHALQRHENTHTKPDSATEAAVLSIERENAMAEKEATLEDKSSPNTSVDNQSASLSISESVTGSLEGQMSNCLMHDVIGQTAAIEEPLEQSGQTLQQAYVQGTQDGTLYYFTGELPTL